MVVGGAAAAVLLAVAVFAPPPMERFPKASPVPSCPAGVDEVDMEGEGLGEVEAVMLAAGGAGGLAPKGFAAGSVAVVVGAGAAGAGLEKEKDGVEVVGGLACASLYVCVETKKKK